jgi:hypothetical protein
MQQACPTCSAVGDAIACNQSHFGSFSCRHTDANVFPTVFLTVSVTALQPLLESVKAGLPEAACAKLNKAQRVVEVSTLSLTLQSTIQACLSLPILCTVQA